MRQQNCVQKLFRSGCADEMGKFLGNVEDAITADYLKRNCLEGANYNLVAKIGKIEDIWGTHIFCCKTNSVLWRNFLI